MEDEIINQLNYLESYLTDEADINLDDYQVIIKYTQSIRTILLN